MLPAQINAILDASSLCFRFYERCELFFNEPIQRALNPNVVTWNGPKSRAALLEIVKSWEAKLTAGTYEDISLATNELSSVLLMEINNLYLCGLNGLFDRFSWISTKYKKQKDTLNALEVETGDRLLGGTSTGADSIFRRAFDSLKRVLAALRSDYVSGAAPCIPEADWDAAREAGLLCMEEITRLQLRIDNLQSLKIAKESMSWGKKGVRIAVVGTIAGLTLALISLVYQRVDSHRADAMPNLTSQSAVRAVDVLRQRQYSLLAMRDKEGNLDEDQRSLLEKEIADVTWLIEELAKVLDSPDRH